MTRLISLMGRRPSLTRVVVAGYVAVVVLCGALGRVDIAVVLTLPVGVLLYPLYAPGPF